VDELDVWVIVFCFLGLVLFFGWYKIRAQDKEKTEAAEERLENHQRYLDALEAYKKHPNNSNLRQEALLRGRIHYGLGLSAEMSVKNDLDAAGMTIL
jgi:predicted negative regulator of RcsB-dependent stress response